MPSRPKSVDPWSKPPHTTQTCTCKLQDQDFLEQGFRSPAPKRWRALGSEDLVPSSTPPHDDPNNTHLTQPQLDSSNLLESSSASTFWSWALRFKAGFRGCGVGIRGLSLPPVWPRSPTVRPTVRNAGLSPASQKHEATKNEPAETHIFFAWSGSVRVDGNNPQG